MGNLAPNNDINCKQRCSDIINQTKSQIERFNPFSKIQQQIPYAQPLQTNLFAPSQTVQQLFDKIVSSQPLKIPAQFEKDESYQYDQKYWKKQQPNIVIQGHWFKRKPHGLCKIYFPGGQTLFISYFNHGQPFFQDCLIIFDTGSYYHGSLKDFKFDGLGKYVHFDKSVIIEGDWKNGRPAGKVKQKIVHDEESIDFQGEFNQQSEKQGQKCSYIIKNTQKQNQKLFEYYGGFQDDSFFGKGSIKINNGRFEMNGVFKKDIVEIQKLQTDQFHFNGQMDKLLNEGTGKVKIKGPHRPIVCESSIKKGMLNGPGTIIYEDGQMQRVHWFNGIKLKHVRNYDNPVQLNELLERIQIYYSTSKTYSEMTKQLQQYFKGHQMQEIVSPRRSQFSYIFEMITKEKANTIATSTRQSNQISPSKGSKGSAKKQLIIQLQKGKFLYVSCFSRERQ